MPRVVKEEEAPDPVHVSILGTDAVVEDTKMLADLVQ
jgi:hypothetical protein